MIVLLYEEVTYYFISSYFMQYKTQNMLCYTHQWYAKSRYPILLSTSWVDISGINEKLTLPK